MHVQSSPSIGKSELQPEFGSAVATFLDMPFFGAFQLAEATQHPLIYLYPNKLNDTLQRRKS